MQVIAHPLSDRHPRELGRARDRKDLLARAIVGTFPEAHQTCIMRELFLIFLRLGLTSFGGPVAHLGYFRSELVERRRWLTDAAYADLVALCQFLPGPASSQVVIGIGFLRGGYLGALLASLGFTLPSMLLMIAFGYGLIGLGDLPGVTAAVVGLLIAAFYDPVLTTAVSDGRDAAVALGAFALLVLWRIPAWLLVLSAGLGAVLMRVLL